MKAVVKDSGMKDAVINDAGMKDAVVGVVKKQKPEVSKGLLFYIKILRVYFIVLHIFILVVPPAVVKTVVKAFVKVVDMKESVVRAGDGSFSHLDTNGNFLYNILIFFVLSFWPSPL